MVKTSTAYKVTFEFDDLEGISLPIESLDDLVSGIRSAVKTSELVKDVSKREIGVSYHENVFTYEVFDSDKDGRIKSKVYSF